VICDKWTLLKHYKIFKGNMQVRTCKSQTSATNSRLVLQWYTQIDVVYYNKLNTCWNCMTLNDKLEWAVILFYNVSKSTRGNCMTESLLVSWNVSENFITWLAQFPMFLWWYWRPHILNVTEHHNATSRKTIAITYPKAKGALEPTNHDKFYLVLQIHQNT